MDPLPQPPSQYVLLFFESASWLAEDATQKDTARLALLSFDTIVCLVSLEVLLCLSVLSAWFAGCWRCLLGHICTRLLTWSGRGAVGRSLQSSCPLWFLLHQEVGDLR